MIQDRLTAPALGATAVTPSDTVDLPDGACRGIYVGTAGDVKVDMARRGTVTYKNLAAGVIHPISARRIWATGTAAADILANY